MVIEEERCQVGGRLLKCTKRLGSLEMMEMFHILNMEPFTQGKH